MYLSKIDVGGFRNIERAELNLNRHFNYIYGDNGAGKTALLEAIYALSRGRSFRTQRTQTLINNGMDDFFIRGEAEYETGSNHALGLSKDNRGQTTIRIDGQSTSKTSELAWLLPSQVLLPDAAELIYGAPGGRRSFLDWGLFHVERSYLAVSRKYRRALLQRNTWLKEMTGDTALEQDPWLEQVVEHGTQIARLQSGYIELLKPHFQALMKMLFAELSIDISYEWGGLENAENALKKWSESFSRDVKFGITHRGPHRSDLTILHQGVNAADVLSRGQAKAVASALILAQAVYQISKTERACVLLIDDFGAELDTTHWQQFLGVLKELDCQVIATSTEVPEANEAWVEGENCAVFHVKQGDVEQIR